VLSNLSVHYPVNSSSPYVCGGGVCIGYIDVIYPQERFTEVWLNPAETPCINVIKYEAVYD